jgi:hypothetical protein
LQQQEDEEQQEEEEASVPDGTEAVTAAAF